jgi:hypothetical protein
VGHNWNNIGPKELFEEEQTDVDSENEYGPDFSLRKFLRKGMYEEDDTEDKEKPQAESRGTPSRHSSDGP